MRFIPYLAASGICATLSISCKQDATPVNGKAPDDDAAASSGGAPDGTDGGGSATTGGTGGAGVGSPSINPDGTGGAEATSTRTLVFFGIGQWGGTGAVHTYSVDEATLGLSKADGVEVGTMNSYAAFHPQKPILYVGDEAEKRLRAYSIDSSTGKLTFLDDIATGGGPVYVSVDSTGQSLLTAYYNQGSVEAFTLEQDGSFGASATTLTTGTQAHAIVLSPDDKFAFVPHKGDDNVMKLDFSPSTPTLEKGKSVDLAGGPRHLAFHPDGTFAYVVNELAATVTAFSYDEATGAMSPLGTVDAFQPGAAKSGADIHVTPNGHFLYASNRSASDSTLALFSVSQDGKLSSKGFVDTRGSTPRNFAIHPSGEYLIAANQESNNVAMFKITGDGSLEFVETTDMGASVAWVGFLVVPR